jgi:hypothetical protein
VEPKKGGRQLPSAIRILEDYGLVRSAGGSLGPLRVRLIATPKRISRELGVGGRERELALLRRLWRLAGGEAAYDGVELERSSLARGVGAPDALARLLDGLQKQGFLSWSTVLEGDGVQVLDTGTPLARVPVDWQGVEMRRRREDRRLQQMQGYVYHEGCRRGYVLRYFGDADAMEHCGACDNCREPGPIQALAPAPEPKRGARRAARAARQAAPAQPAAPGRAAARGPGGLRAAPRAPRRARARGGPARVLRLPGPYPARARGPPPTQRGGAARGPRRGARPAGALGRRLPRAAAGGEGVIPIRIPFRACGSIHRFRPSVARRPRFMVAHGPLLRREPPDDRAGPRRRQHAITISAHNTLGTSPILNFGTEEQKRATCRCSPRARARRLRADGARRRLGRRRDATTAVRENGGYRSRAARSSSRTPASARSSSSRP